MTNNTPMHILRAKKSASDLISRYGITEPEDIRLEDIAYDLGVSVVEGTLENASARLVVNNKNAVIRVNQEEAYPFRKRFSIAHELGHFILEHGHSLERICDDSSLNDWYGGSEEAQANAFAAELLLPKSIFEPRCDVREVSLDVARELSQEFQVSLTPTARRFVELNPESCALVFSQGNKIKWVVRSASWKHFLRTGEQLNSASAAALFFKEGKVIDEPIEARGDTWLDSPSPEYLTEHTMGTTKLGFTISILWEEPTD